MSIEGVKIGDRFTDGRGKSQRICTVVDILTTINSRGEVVRTRYLAEHSFCGQRLTQEVCAVTVLRNKAAA